MHFIGLMWPQQQMNGGSSSFVSSCSHVTNYVRYMDLKIVFSFLIHAHSISGYVHLSSVAPIQIGRIINSDALCSKRIVFSYRSHTYKIHQEVAANDQDSYLLVNTRCECEYVHFIKRVNTTKPITEYKTTNKDRNRERKMKQKPTEKCIQT